jgi:hypothetical protein
MTRLCSFIVFVTLGSGLAACTSEVATSWVPQDLDLAETMDNVGEEAYGKLCDQFSGYVHELYSSQLLVRAACTAHAVRTTRNTTECMHAMDDCLATLPPPVEHELESILTQASCERSNVLPSGCRAPVGELVACLDDLRGTLERLETSATCGALGSPLRPDWWRVVQPASCIELATRCRPRS